MFKILIVEDQTTKLAAILNVLNGVSGINIEHVETEIDATSAKRKMRNNIYDLLILDIAIPTHKIQEVDPKGGLKLLDEILNRPIYNIPTHIIGLTAYPDIFKNAIQQFSENILTVIQYDASSVDWSKKLALGAAQRVKSKSDALEGVPDYEYDVAIICALNSELEAHKSNGWIWQKKNLISDYTIYYETGFKNKDNKDIKIIAATANRMGMPFSGALAMKMIMAFRPRYIIMTGIMAGVEGKVGLGDVVFANPIWDWGSGKWSTKTYESSPEITSTIFEIDPFQFSLDSGIEKFAFGVRDNKALLFELRNGFQGTIPSHDINVHVGPIATGSSVLSDDEKIDDIQEQQHRKLLGVEMEGYSVFSAASLSPLPRPVACCIKSVVDFGNGKKDDTYHSFGTYISSAVAKKLIEYLIQ